MPQTFTLFEPIFYFIVLLSLILLLLTSMPKFRARLYPTFMSVAIIVLIIFLFITESLIVAQFDLTGDEKTFTMGIVAVTLNVLTVYFAFRKPRMKK
ncbi:hypothetical protein [Kurthia senegalensis]|uniref:hypothetical protein n=1 Tax=Kurthia senegalensis TaxID=1033740 RepID=UPI00028A0C72|nr:hypothetical protein [Kurthia senegalensis]